MKNTLIRYASISINNSKLFVRRHPLIKAILLPFVAKFLPMLKTRHVELSKSDYKKWIIKYDTLSDDDRGAIRAHIESFERKPFISVVMTTYNTPEKFLKEAINSLRSQIYQNWELCIADDASSSPHISEIINEFLDKDPRIRWVRKAENGHISAASNTALGLSKGEWIVLMDHDDLLSERALYEISVEILGHPNAQVVYTDEDKIDAKGQRYEPYFKPDFDEDLLMGQNMISHLGAYRRDLLTKINGFREGFEGSQDHDLALRAISVVGAAAVRHVPSILYHWRQTGEGGSFSESSLQQCVLNSRRAVQDHLLMKGVDAKVGVAPAVPIWHRISYPIPNPAPLVSIIIPTRDRADLLRVCLDGILHQTEYPAIEVLVADNGSAEPEALALLAEIKIDDRIKVIPISGPFNFSRSINVAAREATGEIILLLNNDIEIMDGGWLAELVSHAVRPDIGAVGAKLVYANGRLQHGGVVLGVGGVADHLLTGVSGDDPGPFGMLALVRTVGAVTAACMALRREVWDMVGGMDEENLAVAFNDVDLCLRIRNHGLRILWTPFAKLKHIESASRGIEIRGEKAQRFQQEGNWMKMRWKKMLINDPYYNKNYSIDDAHCHLATPPRVARPWIVQKQG